MKGGRMMRKKSTIIKARVEVNKKMIIISIILLIIGGCLFWALKANGSSISSSSKIVYIDNPPKGVVSLYVSDNHKIRSNKIKLASWNEKNNWFSSSMYYILGGVHLRNNILYYCDVNRKKIVAYDLLTNKKKDLVSGVLYPFFVNENGTLLICSTSMENERERNYKLVDLSKNYFKEFSLPSSFNQFIRPLKLMKGKYILFDTARYESEGGGVGYFLYDYEKQELIPKENYDEDGNDINSMDQIAIYGNLIAYMDSKGKNINYMTQSINTLHLLNLDTMKNEELFHDDNIDIQYIAFKDNGRNVEMMGNMAISKGKSEDDPFLLKPITVVYDLQTNIHSIKERKSDVPSGIFSVNFSNEIGIFSPKSK